MEYIITLIEEGYENMPYHITVTSESRQDAINKAKTFVQKNGYCVNGKRLKVMSDKKERVTELLNQIGNSLDAPEYAEKVLTECGKEILQIIDDLEGESER